MPVSTRSAATNHASVSNRRSSRRLQARKTVSIEVRKGTYGFGANLAAELLDVSEGGARVILKVPLDIDEEAEVTLTGYGVRKAIKRVALVCWSVKLESGLYATGLHFEKRLRYQDVTGFCRS